MVLLGLVFGLQASLLSDVRLHKTANYDISLRQIGDFVADVSRERGVNLSVSKNLLDLKVDVFVDGVLISEVLDKVAKTFNCEWVADGNGYRLEMEAKYVNRERNFNQAEEEEARHRTEVELWACEYVARLIPGTDRYSRFGGDLVNVERKKEIYGPFEKDFIGAQASKNPMAIAEALEKYSTICSAIESPTQIGIGRVLMQLDKSAKDRFWKGETFIASTLRGNGLRLWPSDCENSSTFSYQNKDGKAENAPHEGFSFLSIDQRTGMLHASLLGYTIVPKEYGGGGGASHSKGPFSGSSTRPEIFERLKRLPFYKDLEPWIDEEGTPKKFPQKIDAQTKVWPSPWKSGRRRLGDHLRWLHIATGIPVVAQADRSCVYEWAKLNRSSATANEYLHELISRQGSYCIEDHGFLMARNYRYWTHRLHEAPESLWSRLEPKDRRDKTSLDEQIGFSLNLREDQMHTNEIEYPLSRADLGNALWNFDMLRFYAGLSESERNAARGALGIAAAELSTSQQARLDELLKKLITKSGSCSFELAKYLYQNGFNSDLTQRMRFHLGEGSYQSNESTHEVRDGDEIIEKSEKTEGKVTNISFEFVLGKDLTVSQSMSYMGG